MVTGIAHVHLLINYMSLCMRKPTIWVGIKSDTNHAVQPQKPDFGAKEKGDCSISVAKAKALITAKLICVVVFANADSWFSHAAAHIMSRLRRYFPIGGYSVTRT